MRTVTFHVTGKPEPKGSTKAYVPASWAKAAAAAGTSPRAIVTADNPAGKDWQRLVAERAQTVLEGGWFEGPVAVAITFALVRPKSAPRRVTWPAKKPDLDKLARLVLDGLTGILFADDAQVVDLRCRKMFATAAPGCEVTVCELAAASDEPALQHFTFEEALL